jgi:hypothetical protein
MRLLERVLLAASIAMLTVMPAQATLIQFDDRTDTPALIVNGNPVSIPPGESFNGSFVDIQIGSFGPADVRVIALEAFTTDVSDIISLHVAPGTPPGTTTINYDFASDAETPLTYVPNPSLDVIMHETGAFQTIYSQILDADHSLIIQFASDAPEPATLALLAIGLAGIGFSRQRAKLL